MDCVIEVHDARIPFSGRNNMLKEAFGSKPYVLVLNKADLIQVIYTYSVICFLKYTLVCWFLCVTGNTR